MSQEIQEQLHKQQEVIADKQMSVKEDLDKVEPAVIEAQNGVCTLSEVWLSGEGGQIRGPSPRGPGYVRFHSVIDKSQVSEAFSKYLKTVFTS